jgi:hypothetical protein
MVKREFMRMRGSRKEMNREEAKKQRGLGRERKRKIKRAFYSWGAEG